MTTDDEAREALTPRQALFTAVLGLLPGKHQVGDLWTLVDGLLAAGYRPPADEAAEATATERLRVLTRRFGFGNGITEPQAPLRVLVEHFERVESEASEWREHERFRDDCAVAGHDSLNDCGEHHPTCCTSIHAADAEATATRHVVHVTASPIAEDVVWCEDCEEWVTSGELDRAALADHDAPTEARP